MNTLNPAARSGSLVNRLGTWFTLPAQGRRAVYLLNVAIIACTLLFLVWAAFASLAEITRGEARVIPSRSTQKIQNLEGGIVAALLVHEGAHVKAGDILVRIDNSIAASNFQETRARFWYLMGTIARLEAEIADKPDVTFPQELIDKAPAVVADERSLFETRHRAHAQGVAVAEQQLAQRRQELNDIRARLHAARRNLELAREEYRIGKPLVAQKVISRLEFLSSEGKVNQFQGEIASLATQAPKLEAAISEAEAHLAGVRESALGEAKQQLSEARSAFEGIRQSVEAGEDKVRRTEVRSPVDGIVQTLYAKTIGGVIKPGEDILEIVPTEEQLLIEAHIRPADIAFLRPGLPALIKITAYDFSLYGGLAATLERISPDTIADEHGNRFYRVILRTTRNDIERGNRRYAIIPGMTATAEIQTGEKTLLQYLVSPTVRLTQEALTER
jgi:adhesin transport system membrane fusion protein